MDNRYIAIEGPIGIGKTSLAQLLAERLGGGAILEVVEENPFLSRFYTDRQKYAFQTQLFFLLSRFRQQQELLQQDLFRSVVVSDYLFARIRKRGRDYERQFDAQYLDKLMRAYNDFFFHYGDTPLLVINTSDIDFVNDQQDFENLVNAIGKMRKGTHHYIPISSKRL